MSERILVVHVAGIGDAVVASVLAERLRAEAPGARVTWVCGEPAAPVIELLEGVHEIATVDQRALFRGGPLARARVIGALWARLARGGRFDRALVLHPDPRYRVLVPPMLARRVHQLTRAQHGRMIPVPSRFLGDEYARLASGTAHIGPIERRYEIANARDRFPTSEADRARPRVVLVPGGAKNALRDDALRRWPLEHYVAVARGLMDEGCEVVLIGAASDAWVREAFAGLAVVDRIGALGLRDTIGLIRDCEVVVSHDTGPMHLARLVRTPLVALFGPTNPMQVISRDETVTVLWGGEHLACRPCHDGREFAACTNNLCLSAVSPADVLAAVRRVVAARRVPA